MNINDFKNRKRAGVTQEERDMIRAEYTHVEYDEKDADGKLKYDDPKYNWQMIYTIGRDEKYGREMVCHEHKLRRGLTMGEFYMGGTVD